MREKKRHTGKQREIGRGKETVGERQRERKTGAEKKGETERMSNSDWFILDKLTAALRVSL